MKFSLAISLAVLALCSTAHAQTATATATVTAAPQLVAQPVIQPAFSAFAVQPAFAFRAAPLVSSCGAGGCGAVVQPAFSSNVVVGRNAIVSNNAGFGGSNIVVSNSGLFGRRENIVVQNGGGAGNNVVVAGRKRGKDVVASGKGNNVVISGRR